MSEFKDDLTRDVSGDLPVTPGPAVPPAVTEGIQPEPEQPPLKYYEIIYGVLFDPVQTMKRVVQKPPLGTTLIIVILLALAGLLTSLYIYARSGPSDLGLEMGLPLHHAMFFSRALRAAAPVLAMLGAVFYFVKWFFYSALLHLLADFYGGRGEARTVFVVYGLAGLPEVFLIPLNVLTALISPAMATTVNTLGGIVALIWGVVLLTIGLREAHRLSTGRALAVIFTPVLAVIVLALITVVVLVSAMSAFMPPAW
ncbi:Yip1 family protein [Desulforamulus putei]|uniref:Yip1 family protein n=1 Tax=Desulforamulus putei TaxID=74701 RepID=UPI002FDEE001